MKLPQKPPEIGMVVEKYSKHLGKAIGNATFMSLVKRCEKEYLHWDELRYKPSAGFDTAMVWMMVKFAREPRYRQLALKGANQVELKFNLPDSVQQELVMIDRELAGSLMLDDECPLTTSERERFIVSALQEEAIASSMLEGAATTRREALKMLETGRKPKCRGEQMVLNNYRAIVFIRQQRDAALSPAFLLELQSILTDKTLDHEDEVGRFRTVMDEIVVTDQRDNEIIHTPPPASELDSRLKALCALGNETDGSGFIHPVIRACLLHFQVGFDHPFCDGNGRTARALFYWSMLKNRYWLFEYLPISRFIYKSPVQYTQAYLHCETDGFDVTYFLKYQIAIFEKARQELKKFLIQQRHAAVKAREMFHADGRLNHRQLNLLQDLTQKPGQILVIAVYQSRQRITYETARTDLMNLAEWGYLNMHKIGKRYEFSVGNKLAPAMT